MARKGRTRAVLRWFLILGGFIFVYYIGTTLYGLIRVKIEHAKTQKELLHLRARTLALEARREALKDPEVIKMIAERRLGMRLRNPVNPVDSLRGDSAAGHGPDSEKSPAPKP
ncbi:MAG: septum formation initiator family protein [candidate division WOR-3 bacterium]